MKRIYVSTGSGQLHVSEKLSTAPKAVWVMLHPLPFSSSFFQSFAESAPTDVHVVIPDYPGFGGSDAPAEPFSIEGVADTLGALAGLFDQPVQLIGFHTGCLVAAECSIKATLPISRLILIDIPFFSDEKRKHFIESTRNSTWPPTNADAIQEMYEKDFGARSEVLGVNRAFEFFASHVNATNDPQQAFKAAFEYDVETRFARIPNRVVVIATDSSLRDGTHQAGALISGAVIKDAPAIKKPVFEQQFDALLSLLEP